MPDDLLESTKQPIAESLASDPEVLRQVKRLLRTGAVRDTLESAGGNYSGDVLESIFGDDGFGGDELDVVSGDDSSQYFDGQLPSNRDQLEAIVEVTGRPPLLVRNDNWDNPVIDEIKNRLDEHRTKVQPCLQSIGRIDIVDGDDASNPTQIGSGWMIDDDIMITNAHVADEFASANPNGKEFTLTTINNEVVLADWKREHENSDSKVVRIEKVLWMAEKDGGNYKPHDMAFLRVARMDTELPPPLLLEDHEAEFNQHVATIGYPAKDPFNDTFVMLKYFDNVYNVKRLSPGQLKGVGDETRIEHDCTTLGGSSGSPVINLETGKVLGLHFAGSYKRRNLAVKISFVKERLSKL